MILGPLFSLALLNPPPLSRRAVLSTTTAASFAAIAGQQPQPVFALESLIKADVKGLAPVNLEDLPPGAATAYRQYWPALQLAADYYVFELYDLLKTPGRWDLINKLTESTDIGSAASVSVLEREFLTPMRIISLAFPPDLGGDEMQVALSKFQKAMFQLSRQARRGQSTGNVADPSSKDVEEIKATWELGRTCLNDFYAATNAATESKRLILIPAKGEGYPRSKSLYTQLRKDAALCRNRGGEQLAGFWGGLMVYGTVPGVNPCGNVNMANYFTQG